MKVETKKLKKSRMELKIEVPARELESHLDKAAENISRDLKIPGFRPGKAPKNIVEQQVGNFKLWEEAIRIALPRVYTQALIENRVEVIGQPQISFDKIAPNNPFIFKAVVAILPEIELPDYKKIKVKKNKVEIGDKQVEAAIKELQKSRAKFAKVDRSAEKGDAVEISFKTFLDKIPIDKGESKNHPLIIGEGFFVPGFEDNLIGLKASDKKEFSVRFPKKYHNKQLADRDVEFQVEMLNVQKRELPEINDEFAKSLGKFKNLVDLKKNIKNNLKLEAEEKEKSKLEMDIMNKISENTKIELPEILIKAEVEKILGELKDSVEAQGGEFDKYLQSIKKTEDDLKKEFRSKAEKRAKYGLILREIAKKEELKASEKEVEDEIKHTLEHYQHDKKMMEKIQSDEYKDYARSLLVNRKVFEMLRKKCVSE